MPPVSNLYLLMDSSRMRYQLKMVFAVVCEVKSFEAHAERQVFSIWSTNPSDCNILDMDTVFTDF